MTNETVLENQLAQFSTITPEEIKMLFQGERRIIPVRECWDEENLNNLILTKGE